MTVVLFVSFRSDGRQSAVVTKVFVVDHVPSELQEPSDNNQEYPREDLAQSDVCVTLVF